VETPRGDYVVGLDLGQAADYTALCVLQRSWVREPDLVDTFTAHYCVAHLVRWQLHTSYTTIVSELADLVQKPPLNYPLLAVDQTGVGRAVVDLVRQAEVKAVLRPITITAGHAVTAGDDCWNVPKKELASTVQALLQDRRLVIAKMPERELLSRELLNFKVKITLNANETFEAWRTRDHDDMVLSVALAAWLAERRRDPHPYPSTAAGVAVNATSSATPPPGPNVPVPDGERVITSDGNRVVPGLPQREHARWWDRVRRPRDSSSAARRGLNGLRGPGGYR
jgi:hypothetical protein